MLVASNRHTSGPFLAWDKQWCQAQHFETAKLLHKKRAVQLPLLDVQTSAHTKPKVRIPVFRGDYLRLPAQSALAGDQPSLAAEPALIDSSLWRSLSNVTCGAKLDDFTPLRNDVVAIDLL